MLEAASTLGKNRNRYGSVTKHMGIASKNVLSFSISDLLIFFALI
jgi:hypothetical protein